jgi:hypothetical protein
MQLKPFLFLLLVSVFVLDSCKRGEDDPKFSFRTRKNRVTGEWILSTGTYRHTKHSSGNAPEGEQVTFTENQYTYVEDVPGTIYTAGYKGSYSRRIKFSKDGYVRIAEMIDGFQNVTEGTWDFNSGVGEYKNKELIIIHVQSYTSSSGTSTYAGTQQRMTYQIKELRNKKMVLYLNDSNTDEDGHEDDVVENLELQQ